MQSDRYHNMRRGYSHHVVNSNNNILRIDKHMLSVTFLHIYVTIGTIDKI